MSKFDGNANDLTLEDMGLDKKAIKLIKMAKGIMERSTIPYGSQTYWKAADAVNRCLGSGGSKTDAIMIAMGFINESYAEQATKKEGN